MDKLTLLQLFLACNIFVIGALTAVAIQHAYAHFRPGRAGHGVHGSHESHRHELLRSKKHGAGGHDRHDDQDDYDNDDHDQDIHLPPAVRERLIRASQTHFQQVLERSAARLEDDLQTTATQLNRLLQKLGGEIASNELERYRLQLEQIRKQAGGVIDQAQDEIDKHQAQLKAELQKEQAAMRAKLAAEIHAEKQRHVQEILAERQQLAKQIDTKLADAVASFLLETLGNNVDLGSQNAYLVGMLEQHKDELKRELKT